MHIKDKDSAETEEKASLYAKCRYNRNSHRRILLYLKG